jgi:tRNA A-37 threonylcarbamoyl transferase component Bud32/tetratricopeptide (TPR) repeat protein
MPDLLERLGAALANRYAVESAIGRGGMATVFLAEDVRHHRRVAIKVLHPELASTVGAERFLQEIEVVAGLNHPHILPVHDSGEADGLLFFVMPFVEGESLRQRLDREGQLPVEMAVQLGTEVAGALDYAHRRGVIHRDIKPGNILLSEGHAVLADFGIARAISVAAEDRVTSTGLGVGTPLYASPEQTAGQETLDGRTDIYSLGCVLYEMLAGEVPLAGATPQSIQAKRLSETPTPLTLLRDTVPPALNAAIGRALARVPADRWETAAGFATALKAATVEASPNQWTDPGRPATTTAVHSATDKGRGSKRRMGGLVVAALAVVAAIAGYLALGRTDGSDQPRIPIAADRMEARQLYLRGDASWESAYGDTELDVQTRTQLALQAAARFDSATQLDPESADGWAGLARVFAFMGAQRLLPADSAFPLVLEPAERAIALDSTSARAYEALGLKYYVFDWQWQKSYDAFMTAARLEPGNPDLPRWLAWAAMIQTDLGRPDSARATIRSAPETASDSYARVTFVRGLQYARDFEAALAEARLLVDEAGFPGRHQFFAWEVMLQAQLELGLFEDARETLRSIPEDVLAPRRGWCLEAYYFARSGNKEQALASLDDLRTAGVELYPRAEAIVYAWLGDLDRAFELLEAEFETTGMVWYLPSDPAFDPLREDPRFDLMLARMGLECRYYGDGHDCFQR